MKLNILLKKNNNKLTGFMIQKNKYYEKFVKIIITT